MERKLAALKSSVLRNYEEKIDDLLSICESPIERLMLLHLFNLVSRIGSINDHIEQHFSNVEFIEDEINFDANVAYMASTSAIDLPRFGLSSWERIKQYNYRHFYGVYKKLVGIKAGFSYSEPKRGGQSVFRDIEIYPQYEVEIEDVIHRIDIGLLLNRMHTEKAIEIRKIAIECDGHAFHSTKEQKERDDRRSRKLQSDGWKVLRYSGSELHGIGDDEEFKTIFAEIMQVFYAM